jgi:hypothetical protein
VHAFPLSHRADAPWGRNLSIRADAALVIAILLLWQAARIPLEGSRANSLAHAHQWRRLQEALALNGVEDGLVRLVQRPHVIGSARWGYSNVHVFAIVAFMVAARTGAPRRYPALRSTFALLHVPALLAIGLFPLAPPSWLEGGAAPSDAQLTGTISAVLRNSTAAVASEHFGYALFIAGGTLWCARGRWVSWPLVAYPALVFAVIIGTRHHYPLDAVVGALSVAIGVAAAAWLHAGPAAAPPNAEPWRRVLGLAIGIGLLAGWADAISGSRVVLGDPEPWTFAAPAVAVAALLAAGLSATDQSLRGCRDQDKSR